MDEDSLLARVLDLSADLVRRFATVYGITPQPRHRTEALMIVFDRLACEVSPRPQAADLGDDEVVKSLARAAASIELEKLYLLASPDASAEDPLLHDVANIILEALAECGRKLG